MNELRLQYQKETGINIQKKIATDYYGEQRDLRIDIENYIEWLERIIYPPSTKDMVDGDIFFDVNGRLDPLRNFDKVSQDLAEVLLTHLDLDRDYGSELVLTDTSPVFNISKPQVTSYVHDAVERLRSLQRTSAFTTAQEEIASIEQIEVFKNSVWKPYRTAPLTILFDYGVDDIRQNLQFIKDYTDNTTYTVKDKKLNASLEKSIQIVERDNLELVLQDEVIDLWEYIESKFDSNRKNKKR